MINNVSFLGRETMLIDAAEYAARTTEAKAEEIAQKIEPKVIKASSVLSEKPFIKSYPFMPDDQPVTVGTILNQLA